MRLSLWSQRAVVFRISSKLVHAFGLQTPITAECSMRRYKAAAVAMATASWRTCRGHDGMWPSKLRPSRSIGRRVMAFRIYFKHGGRPPFWILKILIFNHVIVVLVLTCCCVPNFIKIGSRVRPPDARNCKMFNAPLLGHGRRHGNEIMGDMSGTWWDVTTQVGSQSVYW